MLDKASECLIPMIDAHERLHPTKQKPTSDGKARDLPITELEWLTWWANLDPAWDYDSATKHIKNIELRLHHYIGIS